MNITKEQMLDLLKEKHIKVIDEDSKIYIDERPEPNIPMYNHNGISLIKDNWFYCHFLVERRNEEEIRIIKQFSNKNEALNYFFIKLLYRYFMDTFIIPSRNFDIKDWDIDIVLQEMKKIGIPSHYLSFGDRINSNSILFSKEGENWYSGYISKNRELIFKTLKGNDDQNWYLSLFGNRVYLLYLFDLYVDELCNRKINIGEITDQDKLILLQYE